MTAMAVGRSTLSTVPGLDDTIPYALRGTLEQVMCRTTYSASAALQVLRTLKTRLAGVTPDDRDVRACRDLIRKTDMVDVAIARLETGAVVEAYREKAAPFVERYKTLERKERERREADAQKAATAHTRYLPTAPAVSEAAAFAALMSAPSQPAGTASNDDADDGYRPYFNVQGASNGTLEGMVMQGETNHVTTVTREVKFAFGMDERPVDLMPFDMCPVCRVAMKYNAAMHQLVCAVPGCGQWKRFADMTASALPYGEEVEFCKYTYRPVTHLDETMKHIEGAEAFVVPPEDLERVMVVLRSRRVAPEDVTLPMIREICDKLKDIKVENAVQYYSRLSGRAPRRMTAYMKEQMRIMFHTQEVPFRKYRADRINNLSFPYTLYKYCELLGYWEMLESLPLLRGPMNLSHHDAILKKVCEDVDWEFIPTVSAQTAWGPE